MKVIARQKPSKQERKNKIKANADLAALLELPDNKVSAYVNSNSKADAGTRKLLLSLIQAVRVLLQDSGLDD